jgi:hypothetical protein
VPQKWAASRVRPSPPALRRFLADYRTRHRVTDRHRCRKVSGDCHDPPIPGRKERGFRDRESLVLLLGQLDCRKIDLPDLPGFPPRLAISRLCRDNRSTCRKIYRRCRDSSLTCRKDPLLCHEESALCRKVSHTCRKRRPFCDTEQPRSSADRFPRGAVTRDCNYPSLLCDRGDLQATMEGPLCDMDRDFCDTGRSLCRKRRPVCDTDRPPRATGGDLRSSETRGRDAMRCG